MSRDIFEQWAPSKEEPNRDFIYNNCLKCGSQRCEGINSEWAGGCPAWVEYNKKGEKMGIDDGIFAEWEGKKMDKCKWVDGELKRCEAIKRIHIRIDYKKKGEGVFLYCPFCGESLNKPIKIEVGMFGKFWDDDNIDDEYGILERIDNDVIYAYETRNNTWKNFKPGLPEGFNKDGTPIVKSRDWSEK